MIIIPNTKILFFRFSNYKNYDFIQEHKKILKENGYVWMLKAGKRSSIDKIRRVQQDGGWMVLRSPKSNGSVSYIANFSDITEDDPKDECIPAYYIKLLDDENLDLNCVNSTHQWFRLKSIESLDQSISDNLVLDTSGKRLVDTIGTTRTAVMFVHNDKAFEI